MILAFVAALIIAGLIAAQYAIHHAEPMLRAKVIESLSQRFNSQVQLGEFHVAVLKGLEVEGKDLSLRSNLDPSLPPQIRVGQFTFHTGLLDVFRSPMHIDQVNLNGLVLMIPPKGERSAMPKAKSKKGHGKISIEISKIVCNDTVLTLMTDDPSKTPMRFEIHALTLKRVGAHKPMHFDAQLVNPKPVGTIDTSGTFGPWDADQPSNSPVTGTYSFTHADLSTTHGITGILSSKGKYSGPLDTITVDGTTDTPDFSVDVSGHPVNLSTKFHAIVNGTNGNTYLQPVQAHFLNTDVTAKGYVVRGKGGKGHDIYLDVVIDNGRIEDLLTIGAKTDSPVMKGPVQLKTKFDLPTGKASVSHRLKLEGTFSVHDALFTNLKIQEKVDELSLRARGKSDDAKQLSQKKVSASNPPPAIPVSVTSPFTLANQKVTLSNLVFKTQGAEIQLSGNYALDGKQFDFTGHARMDASVSNIVGGWKGKLLTPLNPFLSKNGAGTQIPIKITGTQSDPHFGLNF
ncbi:MAG: AsmA-like C-terminal region-containing protein [Acidobacteriaceae bacterium]